MTDRAPESFGWVMDGWVTRLLAWEAAKKSAASIDGRAMPTARARADLAVEEAHTEVFRYKQEMIRGLALVLRWMAEDPFQHDTFASIITGAVSDAFEPVIRRQWAQLEELSNKIALLQSQVNSLLERQHSESDNRSEGPQGSRLDQDGPRRPDDSCVCGHHGSPSGTPQRPIAPPGSGLRQGPGGRGEAE